VSSEGRERFRNVSSYPTELDKWLKKTTSDDTGLTRPPVAMRVSGDTKMRSGRQFTRIFPKSIQGSSVQSGGEVKTRFNPTERERERERERKRKRKREREREM
jgi:hypothetical protein